MKYNTFCRRGLIRLFVAGVAMCLCGNVAAQGRFDAGAWLGANMAQIDGDGAGSYNHIGIAAGIESSFALGDIDSPLRAMVGIGFAQKGSYVADINRRINLSYVEIPVMLTLNFMDSRLRVGAGVAPAVLVNSVVTDDGIANDLQSNNFRRMDALPLCASLRYLIGGNWGLEIRYQNSMLPITKESGSGTYRIVRSNQGAFNRLICIAIAYHWQPSR